MNTDEMASKIKELERELTSLQQQNEQLQRQASIPEMNPVPIFEYDMHGQVVYLNLAAQQALSMLGLDDAHPFLPADFTEIISSAGKNADRQVTRELEINHLTFEELIIYSPEYDTVRIYASDVTLRKRMEDEQRTNLTKYIELFENLPIGVTVTDKNGQLIESNQEASRILELSEEEQKRRLIQSEEWKIIRPDLTPMPAAEFASVRAMQEHRRVENIEMGIIKADDRLTWISVTAAPLPLKDYGIVITYSDITRRMEAEEALHKAHEELESTVQQRTQELLAANEELKKENEERKRIQSQLLIQTRAVEAERKRFNDVLEILPAYLILLTPDYHVSFANRYFRQRFGEDHGRRCYEYLFGLNHPCDFCETYKALQTNAEHHWEWTGPDHRKYDVYDFPFQDMDGATLILEMGIDITARKHAEEDLRLLNNYNRTLLESSPDILVTISPQGKIGDVNAAAEVATGYKREELIGTDFSDYFTDPQKARRGYQQVFTAGKIQNYELEIQHKHGHSTPVIYNASVYRDEDGKVAGVYATARDITEYKRAEEAIHKSEKQFRSLVIATSQIVWQTNAAGEVIEDIPEWRAFTGQSVDEIMNWGWINAVHPQDQERVSKVWMKSLETKTIYDTEYRIRSKTGVYGDFSVRGVPITDNDGNIVSWVGTCTDITEKKNYEKQLIEAEKNAVIGRMVGSVTHEINNPLQTIKNCLYLIQQDTAPDSLDLEPLEMALSETQRLSNIVGQLHQLYRPQAAYTLHPQDLLKILNEVHTLITPHLRNSRVIWKPLLGLEKYTVNCVRDQLIEVFLNICMNAIESMQSAGGSLSVNMVHNIEKNQVGVVISDTGPGIPSDILPHIFEPFITTKEYGLGLGLSISYGIVEKHGGQITVESQPELGTSFTIWLPIFSVENIKIGE